MALEVELKAPAPRGIEARLAALGAKKASSRHQRDTIYDRPGEPLGKKGAVLRLREEGGRLLLTYKSPSKSRRTKAKEEIELAVAPGMGVLLEGLGYRPVFVKEKERTEYSFGGVTVCVDAVRGIGKWVEFEVVGSTAAEARKMIVSAAKRLGIPEARLSTESYVGLLRQKAKKAAEQKG